MYTSPFSTKVSAYLLFLTDNLISGRSEAELVEDIVNDVVRKLNRMFGCEKCRGDLVGIESRVKQVEPLLWLESSSSSSEEDVRFVGIWGKGGIGKTTIAKVVFHRFKLHFDGLCFLEKVGTQLKKAWLRRMKVLVVLDDVDSPTQLQDLLEGDHTGLCGPGIRILVTSRDRQVLGNIIDEDKLYKNEELNYQESFQLFCLKAFKESYARHALEQLSGRLVEFAKGNPMALNVLGSTLFGRSQEDWVSAMDKLGMDRNHATEILGGFRTSVLFNTSNLINKSLVVETSTNGLELHDLIRDMRWGIVNEQSSPASYQTAESRGYALCDDEKEGEV
ncbi:hypothetical protein Tsubulata_019498 [Turnera subulata]|uniref:NB-ARC domain-containing protein n=1 Tax=Turnera subulata TaxID=218843 RepID=A0A9Q0EZW3_9ROSI|nr:hypothetical protein Tsubulata_019498 [Turnera subulata]